MKLLEGLAVPQPVIAVGLPLWAPASWLRDEHFQGLSYRPLTLLGLLTARILLDNITLIEHETT